MTAPTVATEIALAELAYLVSAAGGDPEMLNAPTGMTTYFERDEVISLGHAIQAARLASEDGTDDVTRYFAAIGAVIAASTTTFVVRTGPAPGTISIYFVTDGPCVVVDVADGTSRLKLLPVFPSDQLFTDADIGRFETVVGRFRPDGNRVYAATWREHAAFSDDARIWRATAADDTRDPVAVLQDFVAG
jgi:hypothetical protein